MGAQQRLGKTYNIVNELAIFILSTVSRMLWWTHIHIYTVYNKYTRQQMVRQNKSWAVMVANWGTFGPAWVIQLP